MTAVTSAEERWGGAALCLGSLAYAVAVVAFTLMYGQPKSAVAGAVPTVADRATHYLDRQSTAHAMWLLEVAAVILLAISGLMLMSRAASSVGWAPRRFAWASVSTGSIILVLMYPLMLGGYPVAADADASLSVFAVLSGIAEFIFYIGNCVLFLGLAAAFASEAPPEGALSRGVALAGQFLFFIAFVAGIAMLGGIRSLQAVAPVALLAFLFASYLGYAIARRS